MATEGAKYTPPNLTKVSREPHERVKLLQPGDPWTILTSEPIPSHVCIGFTLSRWYATDEPGRLFKVMAVHAESIETIFIGFENVDPIPG
jgi:hypothetical protein